MKRENFNRFIQIKQQGFTYEKVKEVSSAAAKLYNWAQTAEDLLKMSFSSEFQKN